MMLSHPQIIMDESGQVTPQQAWISLPVDQIIKSKMVDTPLGAQFNVDSKDLVFSQKVSPTIALTILLRSSYARQWL